MTSLVCEHTVLPTGTLLPRATVRAPSRLHLGFLDPSGTLGRRFGSLGVMIEGFDTQLTVSPAPSTGVSAAAGVSPSDVDRASAHLRTLMLETGLHQPLHLHLQQTPPSHSGFGSGTQLALAVGRAFAHCHGLSLETPTLARMLGRGGRSGIGIGGFDRGGLLLDGGPNADGTPAPLLAQFAMPDAWRALVVMDPRCQGLSGAEEKKAIARLPPLGRAQSADICHHILMRVLPGAAHADFAAFSQGVTRVQQLLGEHFALAQGGAYTSPAVGHVMSWMAGCAETQSPLATGQSSWGPTGFAFFASQVEAEALVHTARRAGVIEPALVLHIVRFSNAGAQLV